MPRRQFQADLAKAVEGVSIAGISNVQPGGDDGEFTFICLAQGQQLTVSVLVPELSDYPSSHECMVFGADNAPATVAAALHGIADAVTGKTIAEILEVVSIRLQSTDEDGDKQMLNSQQYEEFDVSDEDAEEYFPGDEDLDPRPTLTNYPSSATGGQPTEATTTFRQRIRDDFQTAKKEGFRVGCMGGLMDGLACHVTVSIRLSKLGISEEAMQAWQLEPSKYLVAIMHYPNGYKNMDDLKSYPAAQACRSLVVRIGISTRYKPTMQEAIQCFSMVSKDAVKESEKRQSKYPQGATPTSGFHDSFISRPLNELLEQRFHMLVKYRYGGMTWNGAELFYNTQVHTASHLHHDASKDVYYKQEQTSNAWPKIVTDDHITSASSPQHSLPLVAMQFILRHFVRCTEFCLICFSKMPDDLEAIKPYVCDNPLCLYQYMSLGFGPSLEHEIISQPKVVDLLVSFCYASARHDRLKDFPSGLGLLVPPTVAIDYNYTPFESQRHHYKQPATQSATAPSPIRNDIPINVTYYDKRHELLFPDKTKPNPVRKGQWIVLRLADSPAVLLHLRVIETCYYPLVRVSEAARPADQDVRYDPHVIAALGLPQLVSNSIAFPPKDGFLPASFYIYNENFDSLSDDGKRQAIATLLDLLPPVRDMKQYLLRNAQSTLSSWVDRLPPAALGVLRWIIASNRACIVQVEREEDDTSSRKSQDRLFGMRGWTQFRFAMGAPDKERRFVQAVQSTTSRLRLQYPTLFAWHGSPLGNWHGIIREGLHFKETCHGRAFGNGVYHSTNVNTSLGYSQSGISGAWISSELQIQQALALNEIVNAPAEYVSHAPHLVVAQLDWIQTRYLFVKTTVEVTGAPPSREDTQPLEVLEQDPLWTSKGINGPLVIPIHAIAASRRPQSIATSQHKRQKASGITRYDPIEIEDEYASEATDEEDLAIFSTEDGMPLRLGDSLPTPNSVAGDKGKGKLLSLASFGNKLFGSKFSAPSQPLTDYVPGSLDYSTLPMLTMPSWASMSATRRLMKDFKELIQVQNKEPLHELGWHIDEDKIENMYQWIVELHSFESTLPLAQDMKQKGIKSIVLELRFGKDYPMSPPFVRIVRPRFLSFLQGGGGHITSGGAMCMQLLTNDGWSAVSSIESVLLQVRMAISSRDPKPARLATTGSRAYGVGEAVEAYMRACRTHGWTIPPGFHEMALGGTDVSLFDG
ncbi:hypothetical protein IAQ61_009854 [Plenodomus lingam]|uniref:uncharacterized protein n=1 Tax=Leptosphaeria maculans TaxID=5022 RepID=UPI0033240C4A|nr:hypothetical protein IAQ61_009854 [Plenodomus lingam]